MDFNERLQKVADEHEISKLLSSWAYGRDNGEWDLLADCYHGDATMNISWISGSASDFVEQSKKMLAGAATDEHGKHNLGDAFIRVAGDRAVSECHVELLRRMRNDTFEFDMITWGRFIDLFERREDRVWRIFERTMVYEKDRMDPVNPDQVPAGYYDAMNLEKFPAACRFLCYRLELRGWSPEPNIITVNSEAEKQLLENARKWLL
ncbi:MAG: nuclear transport factor 2 family protein [Rhodospirillales bacterium]|jgi:hypothetical protein|nr:hypothetical protein [Rhodospirillaceae bacterium]MDP6430516.1 nuclear transport factor 2 family protein [Rhodospirillales bacterium]MDP6644997.1 nuclear transport factor 2 family protein [Rhodospirillales bacterium]MDP6841969.1 nuclear transport factor 2 family protein [Rhodospirillales bacterium]|tara:strand:- start:51 stop:671 length:621 start_codon:yes stop_codon:yes gene_type:complete